LALRFHPKQGTPVLVRFDQTFKPPEMVKTRPCVAISKRMTQRSNLLMRLWKHPLQDLEVSRPSGPPARPSRDLMQRKPRGRGAFFVTGAG
jgi:hypothetical protein